MKKWILIAIVSLFAFALARLVITTSDAVDTDVHNYVNGLNYKLTALPVNPSMGYQGRQLFPATLFLSGALPFDPLSF